MSRRGWIAVALIVAAGGVAAGILMTRSRPASPKPKLVMLSHSEEGRRLLFAEVQPVALGNCELERFGEEHDGGYLLCGNLLAAVESAYSYGISGYDQWGCDVSTRFHVPVHQYDCFNLTRPACPSGRPVFHEECIAGTRRVEDGRPFDTLENQVRRNGDAAKRLVVKIDVEGAEWESFLAASEDVLQRIDQMAVEFHGIDEGRFLLAIRKLRGLFYVANLHMNNFACASGKPPFPASVFEVLLVNKRIGVPGDATTPVAMSPLNHANNPGWRDCQIAVSN